MGPGSEGRCRKICLHKIEKFDRAGPVKFFTFWGKIELGLISKEYYCGIFNELRKVTKFHFEDKWIATKEEKSLKILRKLMKINQW